MPLIRFQHKEQNELEKSFDNGYRRYYNLPIVRFLIYNNDFVNKEMMVMGKNVHASL